MSINLSTMPKLGFGLMRLPQKDGKIDIEQVCRMADAMFTMTVIPKRLSKRRWQSAIPETASWSPPSCRRGS